MKYRQMLCPGNAICRHHKVVSLQEQRELEWNQ
jgi:hypothetical protein